MGERAEAEAAVQSSSPPTTDIPVVQRGLRCSSGGLSTCPSLCNDRRRGAVSAGQLWSTTVAVLWQWWGWKAVAAAFRPGVGAHHTGELNQSQRQSLACTVMLSWTYTHLSSTSY